MSTAKEKEICTPPCAADPDAAMASEEQTPSFRSPRPEAPGAPTSASRSSSKGAVDGCMRGGLGRHRREMAGRVRVPDVWGQEEDLVQSSGDCSAFERYLPDGLALARAALVEDCWQACTKRLADDLRQRSAGRTEIENQC